MALRYSSSLRDSLVWSKIHWLLFVAALPLSLFGVALLIALGSKAIRIGDLSATQVRLLACAALATAAAPVFLWVGRHLRPRSSGRGGWILISYPPLVAVLALPLTEDLEGYLLPLGLGYVAAFVGAVKAKPSWGALVASGAASAALTLACIYAPPWSRSALFHAVEEGDTKTAELLLDLGVGPEPEDGEAWPLLEAVERRDLKMVRLLVAHGAMLYGDTREETSPMMRSIALGFLDATLHFLEVETDRIRMESALDEASGDESRRVATL